MLISKDECCLLVFNVLKDFIPALYQSQKLIDDCVWLLDFAKRLGIPAFSIEHKKLGERLASFDRFLSPDKYIAVSYFSCWKEKSFQDGFSSLGKKQIILAGAEIHISLLQSAIDLKSAGYECVVIADASTARNEKDIDLAYARFKQFQIPLLSKEMFFFECLRTSEFENYMDLSLRFLDGRYIRE